MRFMPLLYVFTLLLQLGAWVVLWSQRRHEPMNRAFRTFLSCMSAWAGMELLLYLPVLQGQELEIQRLCGVFWISSTIWFLLFVYRFLDRPPDLLFKFLAVVTGIGVVSYTIFGMGLLGMARTEWGYVDIRGPKHLALVAIPFITGGAALGMLFPALSQTRDPLQRRSVLLICIGAGLTFTLGLASNLIFPTFLGYQEFPRLASCSALVLLPFFGLAVLRYEFLSVNVVEVAEDLFEDVRDGIVLFDTQHQIQRLNVAARDLFGDRSDRDIAASMARWLRYQEAETDEPIEVSLDVWGEERTLGLTASPLLHHGMRRGTMIFVRDLTELQRAQEILRKSRDEMEEAVSQRSHEMIQVQRLEALSTLSSGIALDFNNLLAAILGFATAARDDLDAEDPVRDDVNEIITAARRSRDLVRQLLDFSRREARRLLVLDMEVLLREAVKQIRINLAGDIKIETAFPYERLFVRGDPTQLHQVVMNLLTNAHHAMSNSGGVLRVALDGADITPEVAEKFGLLAGGPHLILSISDTGTGMGEETARKIFEPFFSTKGAKGTGLGLATVRRIIQEHRGSIAVQSAPGAGATFVITLPLTVKDAHITNQESGPLLTGTEHVLLVDDKEQNVRVNRRMLEPLGYRISSFTDPFEALHAFEKDPLAYDLMVTDQMMPKMTGLELTSKMLEMRPDFPVLVISGAATTSVRQQAKEIGVKALLDKPLSKPKLAMTLRSILGDDPEN